MEKRLFKNFSKFVGKHLCWSLFFYKVAGLRFQHSCFPVNFTKSLRTRFFTKHLRTSASVAHAWFEESEKNAWSTSVKKVFLTWLKYQLSKRERQREKREEIISIN